jgi:hypothetical protein
MSNDSNILDAFVGLTRRVYPDKAKSSDDDEKVFTIGLNNENDVVVLRDLADSLELELTAMYLNMRRMNRSWFKRHFGGTKELKTKEVRHEKALVQVRERIREVEGCGW